MIILQNEARGIKFQNTMRAHLLPKEAPVTDDSPFLIEILGKIYKLDEELRNELTLCLDIPPDFCCYLEGVTRDALRNLINQLLIEGHEDSDITFYAEDDTITDLVRDPR